MQGQKVVASFCAQGARKLRPLRSASRSSLNGLASESRPSENERPPRFFDCRKWKTTARPRKTLPGSLDRGREKRTSARGRNRAGTLARTETRLPSWSCAGTAGCPAASATPGGCASRDARPLGHRSCGGAAAPAAHGAGKRACPTLDSSSKTDLETCGQHSTQSARQGGTEPGTTRFKDGRTTTRPPAPRRGPGAPHGSAAAKAPRPRKRARLARSEICDFGPELRFEQRNRFRSLRDTRRTEKKVLRKPPAARPVAGQTFKYIY